MRKGLHITRAQAPAQLRARKMAWLAAACCMFATASAVCGAAGTPKVIHDSGTGVPFQHLLSQAIAQPDAPRTVQQSAEAVQALVAFPVRTEQLRPGRLQRSAHWPQQQWLTQPLFLVGDDPASRRWLRANAQRLQALGASGLAVNVPTATAFVQLQHLAPDVAMAPTSARWLGQQLARRNAAVLPLVIMPNGAIVQQLDGSGAAR